MTKNLWNLWGVIKPKDWEIIFKKEGKINTAYDGVVIKSRVYYGYLSYSKSRDKYKIWANEYPDNWLVSNTFQALLDEKIKRQNT